MRSSTAVSLGIALGALSVLWLVLSRAEPSSFVIGFGFIALALLLQLRLHNNLTNSTKWRMRPSGLLRFTAFFLLQSYLGAVDVSRRIIWTKPAVNPGFYIHQTKLNDSFAQRFFIGVISLLPGTLVVDSAQKTIRIHLLNQEAGLIDGIRQLENQVAALFGETYAN